MLSFFQHASSMTYLLGQMFYWMTVGAVKERCFSRAHLVQQMVFAGVRSVGIVILINGFMGAIIAMQTAYLLKMFGSLMYTGSLVSVSFTREIGPLLTALIVSGRVGSAMTAELGTMTVSEEVDALDVMGIHPVRFLVVPRVLALMLMLPLLTVVADVVGMVGGLLVGTINLHIDVFLYIDKSIDVLTHKDLYTGLIKSFFFAVIIGLVSCYRGLIVRDGAQGVGSATTISVVQSMMMIVAADCFFTALFYFVF